VVKKLKKTYETPNTGWNEERINREDGLMEDYGLKNKKEIYKAQSQLRSFRREARKLIAAEDSEEAEKEVINKANSLGLIREGDGLEGLLTLNVTDILDRRIQTAVERRGLADTPKHARQVVVHGHVYVDGERVNTPGYLLTQEEETELEVRMPEPEDDNEDESSQEGSSESEPSEESENQEEAEGSAEEDETEEEDN
jgi:small subunit ribosomal protein S4